MQQIDFEKLWDAVKEVHPLIHHLTNYVTVNDCANIVLACGASPVMADSIDEAADMASISQAVVLNIGTLCRSKAESMMAAGRAANRRGIPVIFDPVGCGATPFRDQMAEEILEEVHPSVIRGNASEVTHLCTGKGKTKGVEALSGMSLAAEADAAIRCAHEWNCVCAVTGPIDTITDGQKVLHCGNGSPLMSLITGTGCMCTSLIGALCGASPEDIFSATAAAVAAMGLAGEIAEQKEGKKLGHFHMGLFDAISTMTGSELQKKAKIYEA